MYQATGAGKGWSLGKQYVPRKECARCSKEFYAPPVQVRRGGGIYCSKTCKGLATRGENNANWKQVAIDCEVCGKKFNLQPCRIGRRTICSDKCRTSKANKKKAAIPIRVCATCGEGPLAENQRRFCSTKCAGVDRTNERAWNWKGGSYVNRFCDSCGKVFAAYKFDVAKGMGRFCSHPCVGRWKSSHAQVSYSRGRGGKREDLDGIYFRSMWEANWARYLNVLIKSGNITRWEFEPDTFEFPVKRGSKFYTPDFKVYLPNDTFYYYEIKGYMDARSATKLKRMKTHHPSVEIRLIESKAYYEVAKKLGGAIPGWERDSTREKARRF